MSHRQRAFIRHWTRLAEPPLVPEVRLHLAEQVMPLWEALARDASEPELPPPYWAFAWAGGQALARYLVEAHATKRDEPTLYAPPWMNTMTGRAARVSASTDSSGAVTLRLRQSSLRGRRGCAPMNWPRRF